MLLLVSGATTYPRSESVGHLVVPRHRQIAQRIGYTRIAFVERDQFLVAVAEYHAKLRALDGRS